jgi:hypothetical protein
MGIESANQAGTPLPNRVTRAKINDAKAIKGETSDPCYCGQCDMTDARFE